MTAQHFRIDEPLATLRKRPQWAAFHRACGRAGFFFKTGAGEAVCFTVERGVELILAHGSGPTPVSAVIDAHNRSGRATSETLIALMELSGI